MWYFPLLRPYVDHVPVKADLSDLESQVQWCRDNDEKCKVIAKNAGVFYDKYLSREGLLDYLELLVGKIGERTATVIEGLFDDDDDDDDEDDDNDDKNSKNNNGNSMAGFQPAAVNTLNASFAKLPPPVFKRKPQKKCSRDGFCKSCEELMEKTALQKSVEAFVVPKQQQQQQQQQGVQNNVGMAMAAPPPVPVLNTNVVDPRERMRRKQAEKARLAKEKEKVTEDEPPKKKSKVK